MSWCLISQADHGVKWTDVEAGTSARVELQSGLHSKRELDALGQQRGGSDSDSEPRRLAARAQGRHEVVVREDGRLLDAAAAGRRPDTVGAGRLTRGNTARPSDLALPSSQSVPPLGSAVLLSILTQFISSSRWRDGTCLCGICGRQSAWIWCAG